MKHSSPPPSCPPLLPKKVIFSFSFFTFLFFQLILWYQLIHFMKCHSFSLCSELFCYWFSISHDRELYETNTWNLKLFLLLQLIWLMSKDTFPINYYINIKISWQRKGYQKLVHFLMDCGTSLQIASSATLRK